MVTGIEPAPRKDELRYLDYAQNLATHNVFGLRSEQAAVAKPPSGQAVPDPTAIPTAPGNPNAPIYPWLLSLALRLDPGGADYLACQQAADAAQIRRRDRNCAGSAVTVLAIQYLQATTFLTLLWLLARLWSGSNRVAWLTFAMGVLAAEPLVYAQRLLTENTVLVLFVALQVALLQLLRTSKQRWGAAAGALLGLLTLTRPEYLYLSMLVGLACALWLLWRGWMRRSDTPARQARQRLPVPLLLQRMLWGALAFAIVVAPWSWRNYEHFNDPALTGGQYGEIILAERISYNAMNPVEWGAMFVYFLPDFGDKLAEAVLPLSAYENLINANPDGYYANSRQYADEALAAAGPDGAVGWLIRHKIIADLPTHAATSLALAWRGVFIAKYWGILGLAALCCVLWRARWWQPPPAETLPNPLGFVLVLAPAALIFALHAGISVNVPRYNLILLPSYALAMGYWLSRATFMPAISGRHPSDGHAS